MKGLLTREGGKRRKLFFQCFQSFFLQFLTERDDEQSMTRKEQSICHSFDWKVLNVMATTFSLCEWLRGFLLNFFKKNTCRMKRRKGDTDRKWFQSHACMRRRSFGAVSSNKSPLRFVFSRRIFEKDLLDRNSIDNFYKKEVYRMLLFLSGLSLLDVKDNTNICRIVNDSILLSLSLRYVFIYCYTTVSSPITSLMQRQSRWPKYVAVFLRPWDGLFLWMNNAYLHLCSFPSHCLSGLDHSLKTVCTQREHNASLWSLWLTTRSWTEHKEGQSSRRRYLLDGHREGLFFTLILHDVSLTL